MRYEPAARFPFESGQHKPGPVIALLAAHNALFQGLARALEQNRPGTVVVILDGCPIPGDTTRAVDLVLVHDHIGSTPLDERISACRAVFPNAAFAVMSEDVPACVASCGHLFSPGPVAGVVPLDFELDLWLAAVALLVHGGEYYPFISPQAASGTSASANARPLQANGADAASGIPEQSPRLEGKGLTNRELQILKLVSMGHQNKHIAHGMALSEHTVKVHVHNLITKLGVSNRTQAAAIYQSSPGLHADAAPFGREDAVQAAHP